MDRESFKNNPLFTIEDLQALHDDAYHWTLSLCNYNVSEAEEILQIAYIEVLDGKAVFNGEAKLKTWWFAVIRNIAMQYFRRLTRQLHHMYGTLTYRGDNAEIETLDEKLCETQRNQHILDSINKLPQRQKEIIQLVFYRNLTIEEAAIVMGLSIGTARMHYQRAKKGLKRIFCGVEMMGDDTQSSKNRIRELYKKRDDNYPSPPFDYMINNALAEQTNDKQLKRSWLLSLSISAWNIVLSNLSIALPVLILSLLMVFLNLEVPVAEIDLLVSETITLPTDFLVDLNLSVMSADPMDSQLGSDMSDLDRFLNDDL